ncbi:MAG: thiosulfate oxidation carrier protein SoxY [Kangiellaceae bacterium]
MKLTRRNFIVDLLKGSSFIALATSFPTMAFAKWNEKAFKAKQLKQALESKYGKQQIVDSGDILLKAPTIAENGAVVPIRVSTNIANTNNISLFVKDNPTPLIASLNFGETSIPEIQIRIRMAKTSEVIAIVEADGKLYQTKQLVKVTIGGCGG